MSTKVNDDPINKCLDDNNWIAYATDDEWIVNSVTRRGDGKCHAEVEGCLPNVKENGKIKFVAVQNTHNIKVDYIEDYIVTNHDMKFLCPLSWKGLVLEPSQCDKGSCRFKGVMTEEEGKKYKVSFVFGNLDSGDKGILCEVGDTVPTGQWTGSDTGN